MANRKLPFDPGSGRRKIMDNMESFFKKLRKLAPPQPIDCDALEEKINEAKKALRDSKRACEPFSGIEIKDAAGIIDSKEIIEQDPPQAVERLTSFLSQGGVDKDREAKIKNNIACAYVRYAIPRTAVAWNYLGKAEACTSEKELLVQIKENRESLSLINERWKVVEALRKQFVEYECEE